MKVALDQKKSYMHQNPVFWLSQATGIFPIAMHAEASLV